MGKRKFDVSAAAEITRFHSWNPDMSCTTALYRCAVGNVGLNKDVEKLSRVLSNILEIL